MIPTIEAVSKYEMRSRFGRISTLPESATTTLSMRDQKIEQMLNLAREMGFVCEPVTKFRQEFLMAVNSHLVHRTGKNIYQCPAFSESGCSRAPQP